jgi:uncharacterized protein YuzE
MKEILQFNGQKVYYEYDEIQDMLYITFDPQVDAAYYSDVEGLDGVMLRYDGESERLVGITVHNVQQKLQRWLVEDVCQRFLAPTETMITV